MKAKDKNENSTIKTKIKTVDTSQVGHLEIHNRSIELPNFIHEISGPEDTYSIFTYQKLLIDSNIIALPVHSWKNNINHFTKPYPEERKKLVLNLYKNHHILLYEPPEFFHFSMPIRLLKHGLAATNVSRRFFNKKMMEENNKQAALKLIPEFESLFVNEAWDDLRYRTYISWEKQKLKCLSRVKDIPEKPSHNPHYDRVWPLTERNAYGKHILTLIAEASKFPSSTFIPTVKPLLSSSDKLDREAVAAQNKQVIALYKKYHPKHDTGRPWLHIYLSHTIFTKSGDTNIHNIVDEIVLKSLDPGRTEGHAGICITVSDWDKAWQVGLPRQNLEGFVTDIGGITSSYNIPLYLARAKWIGEYLIDYGASLTGCMLNGHTKQSQSGGGFTKDDPRKFGKTPLYGYCCEASISDLFKNGKKPGELHGPKKLHHFDNVPDYCNIDFQSNDKRFRCDFSKPRRIATHCTELKEIRDDLRNGKPHAGKNYIERSRLWSGVKQD